MTTVPRRLLVVMISTALCCLLASPRVSAFVLPSTTTTTTTAATAYSRIMRPPGASLTAAKASPSQQDSSSSTSSSSTEAIKKDIADLKLEAEHRLESLLEQMEDLKQMNAKAAASAPPVEETPKTAPDKQTKKKASPAAAAADKKKVKTAVKDLAPDETFASKKKKQAPAPIVEAPLDLLDDTVWKIVFNIGRESGTWMPKEWGKSGDRLLFQCTVDFLSEPATDVRDDFFQGPAKKLNILEHFVIPRGVGDASVGRRPLPIIQTGAYRVCRGHGPAGTDIVRLFIELNEQVTLPDHVSDVYCPAGRVYGTCGYFAVPTTHPADAPPTHREVLQEEYTTALRKYEQLQLVVDSDERGLFDFDHLKAMKDAFAAKQEMERLHRQLAEAKQREPEKSQLRLSKAGNVGLSKEGGVCCKVNKGLALEYHILGRMEVGYVDDHHEAQLKEEKKKNISKQQ